MCCTSLTTILRPSIIPQRPRSPPPLFRPRPHYSRNKSATQGNNNQQLPTTTIDSRRHQVNAVQQMIAEKRQTAKQPVLILGPTGEAAVGFKDTSKVSSLSRANSIDSSSDRIKAFPGESRQHRINSIQLTPDVQQLSPFQMINETSSDNSSSSSDRGGGNPFAHSPSPFDDSSYVHPNDQQGSNQ